MTLWQFFLAIFKISSITFGGGYTIVPVIREEFVCKKQLLDDEEMYDLIALAQSAPGPIAVSTALLTGYKLKGRAGAVLGVLAAILPPLIIISALFYAYEAFASNFWVRAALRGMSGAISAVMLHAVYQMAKPCLCQHKYFSAALMTAAFLAGLFTSINTGLIILALGATGLLAFTFLPEDRIP
ncbi:MAG TPA: chromate transporter [Bacillota bacterium]|jgi:chromate transporter|nr:chromate transporter [Fastidiosipila sp.]HPX93876.1 chromate transporter [Bacillota bacterium]HQB81440.1 chromate transporter [Bacillota bacterium]